MDVVAIQQRATNKLTDKTVSQFRRVVSLLYSTMHPIKWLAGRH